MTGCPAQNERHQTVSARTGREAQLSILTAAMRLA